MRAIRPTASLRVRLFSFIISYALFIALIAPFGGGQVAATPTSGVRAPTAPKTAKAATTSVAQGNAQAARRDGEVIVRFRDNVSEETKNNLVESKGGRRKGKLRGQSRVEKVELTPGDDPPLLAAQLQLHPEVDIAEPNFLITRAQATPNDARYSEQWALTNTGQNGGQPGADIRAGEAWHTVTGSPATIIAVVDSGVDFTHPDLQGNLWVNGKEKDDDRDDDHNGLEDDLNGWDWVTNSGVIRDEQGHGTAIAGLIAAQGNNEAGTTGVMWRAALMSLRVLDRHRHRRRSRRG